MTMLARSESSHLPGEIPGFYRRMDATGPWSPVPLLVAAAPPGGPIEQAVFLDFLDAMRRGLAAALPLDGVYLASHGASSATGDEDSDGTIAAMIRQVVGPAVPVVCSHDLHCNVSETLVNSVDAWWSTAPIRMSTWPRAPPNRPPAARAAGRRAIARAFVRLPLVPPSVTLLTAAGPYAERIAEAEALMRPTRASPMPRSPAARILRPAEMRDDGDGHRARRRRGAARQPRTARTAGLGRSGRGTWRG